jgi:hypothetical protein
MGISDMNSTPPATITSYAPAAISPIPRTRIGYIKHTFFFNLHFIMFYLEINSVPPLLVALTHYRSQVKQFDKLGLLINIMQQTK